MKIAVHSIYLFILGKACKQMVQGLFQSILTLRRKLILFCLRIYGSRSFINICICDKLDMNVLEGAQTDLAKL